jgi:hypothetical protein
VIEGKGNKRENVVKGEVVDNETKTRMCKGSMVERFREL